MPPALSGASHYTYGNVKYKIKHCSHTINEPIPVSEIHICIKLYDTEDKYIDIVTTVSCWLMF